MISSEHIIYKYRWPGAGAVSVGLGGSHYGCIIILYTAGSRRLHRIDVSYREYSAPVGRCLVDEIWSRILNADSCLLINRSAEC